jgi:hypothetical protein
LRVYGDNTETEAFELHASIVALQSQVKTLTLTTAFGYSSVSESDVFGADLQGSHSHREPDGGQPSAG